MTRKWATCLVVLFLLSSAATAELDLSRVQASNGQRVHNLDTGLDYTSIQEAINAPETRNGNTIYVEEGTYLGNIVVNKSVVLRGENRATTRIDSLDYDSVFDVTVDNVTISDFTVTGGGFAYLISLQHVRNCRVVRNIVMGTTAYEVGICLEGCENCSVIGNTALKHGKAGVQLDYCEKCEVSGNNITLNYWSGVELNNCRNCRVDNNLVYLNVFVGLYLYYSENCTLAQNIVNETLYLPYTGTNIAVVGCVSCVVIQNYVKHSQFPSLQGIFSNLALTFSTNCTVTENDVFGLNFSNIQLWDTRHCRIYHNNFKGNCYGIHNITEIAFDDGLEGNYWSDYQGADANKDGIGDTPYERSEEDGELTDRCPLMGMFHSVDVSSGLNVNIISNSSITNVEYSVSSYTIRMYVSNSSITQTSGFCRVTVPKKLMAPPYEVSIDNGSAEIFTFNNKVFDNGTHRWIYFAYGHSTHEVEIQGLPPNTPPMINVLSPQIMVYPVSNVSLAFTLSEPAVWIGFSLDSGVNVTISGNTTMTGLFDGEHAIEVYANNTIGNMGESNKVHFTVDTRPPNIEILLPGNTTYRTSSVMLSLMVNEPTSWIGYTLDHKMNVTIVGNTTLLGLSDGSHDLIVYAKDAAGHVGASRVVYFSVDTEQTRPLLSTPELIITVVLISVVAATTGFVLYRRRKSSEKPSSPK